MEIDINGDGLMEWAEFMQYIIDAVSANTITGGEEDQGTVTEQIAKLKAKKYTRFGLSPSMIDKTSHPHSIAKAIHCESSNLVMCFEKITNEVKFYDYDFKLVHSEKMELKNIKNTEMKKNGFVTAIAYDDATRTFGIATTDG